MSAAKIFAGVGKRSAKKIQTEEDIKRETTKYFSATLKLETDFNRFKMATSRMVHSSTASDDDVKFAKQDLLLQLSEVMAIAKKLHKLKTKPLD